MFYTGKKALGRSIEEHAGVQQWAPASFLSHFTLWIADLKSIDPVRSWARAKKRLITATPSPESGVTGYFHCPQLSRPQLLTGLTALKYGSKWL